MGASNKMAIPQAASSAVKYAFHPWFLTMMDRGTPALAAPVQQTVVITSLIRHISYFALHRQFLHSTLFVETADCRQARYAAETWIDMHVVVYVGSPRYAIQPKNPSDAPTDSGPTSSAPHSPINICGPYRKNPIMKTVAHCNHGRVAGTDQKASSMAATPTV